MPIPAHAAVGIIAGGPRPWDSFESWPNGTNDKVPEGWTLATFSGSVGTSRSTENATDGAYSWKMGGDNIFGGDNTVAGERTVDLTPYSTLTFDLTSEERSGLVERTISVIIGGNTEETFMTAGTYNDTQIDVSGYSGDTTIRLEVTIPTENDSVICYWDNFRLS